MIDYKRLSRSDINEAIRYFLASKFPNYDIGIPELIYHPEDGGIPATFSANVSLSLTLTK
jgi:hypothetical protein